MPVMRSTPKLPISPLLGLGCGLAALLPLLGSCQSVPTTAATPAARSSAAADGPAAARTVEGLIRTLYECVSFDQGGPDWDVFHSLVLPGSVYTFAERGKSPTKVMDLAAFVQDFRDFVASGDVAKRGFHENLARIESTEFGNIAHVFTVFEPQVGAATSKPRRRGVDSIQLVKKRGRWWVASISTQFELDGLKIPARFR